MPNPQSTDQPPPGNGDECSISTANDTMNSQDLAELIRKQVRRQVVEEFLNACHGDQQKIALVQELSAEVLGRERIPSTVVTRRNDDPGSTSSGDDHSSSTDDKLKWAQVGSMDSIEVSPYEHGTSAEVGEELFETFRDLLVPGNDAHNTQRRRNESMQPSEESINVLGRETAQILVTVSHHISQSGMLYSPRWLKGRIREVEVKGINKLMILASLHEQRISRAEKCVLTALVADLSLADIIREVLDDLVGDGASRQFPKLADCMETPFPYQRSQRTECQKCEIFVARAYTCMSYLRRDTIENDTLVTKIFECLHIMEENLEFEVSSPLRRPLNIRRPRVYDSGHKTGDCTNSTTHDEDDKSARLPTPSNKKNVHGQSNQKGRVPMAIEQLDLSTGRVQKRWNSVREANIAMGRNADATRIHNAVAGSCKSAYNYFWRHAGSSALPASAKVQVATRPDVESIASQPIGKRKADKPPLASQPIEKLDLASGKVIGRYRSMKDANISVGKPENSTHIYSVLHGHAKNGYGYFWRLAGSKKLPPGIEKPTLAQSGKTMSKKAVAAMPRMSEARREKDQQTLSRSVGTGNVVVASSLPRNTSRSTETQGESPKSHKSSKQVVLKTVAAHESFSSINDQDIESEDVTPKSIRNVLSGKDLQEDGERFRNVGTADLQNFDMLRSKKRIGAGESETEIGPRKKLRPNGLAEIGNGGDQMTDLPPSGMSFSSFSGRPSTRMISAMTNIHESPYQENATAEIGEEMFDKFKALLQPESNPGRRHSQASDEAIEVFGSTLVANTIVEASSKIAQSGMTYSAEWSEGTIHGLSIRDVPKNVLLLLLQEQRFSRPSAEGALSKIVTDFDLCRKMIRALVLWKLAGKYPKLVGATTHTAFGAQRPQCYKCLIFIVRAFYCAEILKIKQVPESIQRKAESCFEILVQNFGEKPRLSSKNAAGKNLALGIDDDEASLVSGFNPSSPPQKITESSHVLFQVHQLPAAAQTTIDSSNAGVNADMSPRLVAPLVPAYPTSKGSIVQRGPYTASHDNTSWVPRDSEEVILMPLECELAWLVEEAIYCLRDRTTVHWRFLWKYASPALRVDLRRVCDGGDPTLEQLVRLEDKIVNERFSTLRRDVRRKLLKGYLRPKMEQAIPAERLVSREAQEKIRTTSAPSGVSEA